MFRGESDLVKDGITRAYDAEPEGPTYLLKKGNEKHPDKSRIIPPENPWSWGASSSGSSPWRLPPEVQRPEKREFVLRDLLVCAEQEAIQVRASLESNLGSIANFERAGRSRREAGGRDRAGPPQPAGSRLEALPLAVMYVPIAEAKLAGMAARLQAERLEDSGDC